MIHTKINLHPFSIWPIITCIYYMNTVWTKQLTSWCLRQGQPVQLYQGEIKATTIFFSQKCTITNNNQKMYHNTARTECIDQNTEHWPTLTAVLKHCFCSHSLPSHTKALIYMQTMGLGIVNPKSARWHWLFHQLVKWTIPPKALTSTTTLHEYFYYLWSTLTPPHAAPTYSQ